MDGVALWLNKVYRQSKQLHSVHYLASMKLSEIIYFTGRHEYFSKHMSTIFIFWCDSKTHDSWAWTSSMFYKKCIVSFFLNLSTKNEKNIPFIIASVFLFHTFASPLSTQLLVPFWSCLLSPYSNLLSCRWVIVIRDFFSWEENHIGLSCLPRTKK